MSTFFAMFVIFIAMLVTLALAGLVVAYVAFVSQGRDIPRAEWLTEVMRKGAERWSVPTEPAEYRDADRQLHVDHGGIRHTSGR